jgi:hypothetical protein
MEHYINHYQAQNFDFYDLTAIVRKDWILEFCNKIIGKKWNITWQMPSGTRSEALDEEALRAMAQSGQKSLVYAPESGSETSLRLIKKKVKLDRMKDSFRAALRQGMIVKLNIVMGFPHETVKEIYETIRFLFEVAVLGVHEVSISCFSPYPGSELFEQLRQSGRIAKLDDNYFRGLMSQIDLKNALPYNPRISGRELNFYRLLGMSVSYALTYLSRPARIIRTFRNLFFLGRSATVFEQRILEHIKNYKQSHRPKEPVPTQESSRAA